MNNELFTDFNPVSAKAWKQKIQFDLKGADYNETLIWQSLEGIHVKPFYHQDDFKKAFSPVPGHPQKWNIGQALFIDDETITNKIAKDVLARGADALFFTSEKEFDIQRTKRSNSRCLKKNDECCLFRSTDYFNCISTHISIRRH